MMFSQEIGHLDSRPLEGLRAEKQLKLKPPSNPEWGTICWILHWYWHPTTWCNDVWQIFLIQRPPPRTMEGLINLEDSPGSLGDSRQTDCLIVLSLVAAGGREELRSSVFPLLVHLLSFLYWEGKILLSFPLSCSLHQLAHAFLGKSGQCDWTAPDIEWTTLKNGQCHCILSLGTECPTLSSFCSTVHLRQTDTLPDSLLRVRKQMSCFDNPAPCFLSSDQLYPWCTKTSQNTHNIRCFETHPKCKVIVQVCVLTGWEVRRS